MQNKLKTINFSSFFFGFKMCPFICNFEQKQYDCLIEMWRLTKVPDNFVGPHDINRISIGKMAQVFTLFEL